MSNTGGSKLISEQKLTKASVTAAVSEEDAKLIDPQDKVSDTEIIEDVEPIVEDDKNESGEINVDMPDIGKSEFITKGSIIEEKNETSVGQAHASLDIDDKQEDLLYVELKMVHADTNKNKDHFESDELVKSETTPVFKLVNWEHGEPNIGVIYESAFVEATETEPAYLAVKVAISKYKYPEYAQQIIERHKEDELYFSMETWFKQAQCNICDACFDGPEDEYCSHLQSRLTGASTHRILRDLTFAGVAVVKTPADVLAESLAIAATQEDNPEEETKLDKTYTQEELTAAVETAVKEALAQDNVAQENERLSDQVNADAQTIAGLTEKANDLAAENVTLNESIEQLKSQAEEVKTEFDAYKVDVEATEVATKRADELASLGYVIPAKTDEEAYATFIGKLKECSEAAFELMKEMVQESAADEDDNGSDNAASDEGAGNSEASASDDDKIPTSKASAGNTDVCASLKTSLTGILNGTAVTAEA
jgi:hypothetical protein